MVLKVKRTGGKGSTATPKKISKEALPRLSLPPRIALPVFEVLEPPERRMTKPSTRKLALTVSGTQKDTEENSTLRIDLSQSEKLILDPDYYWEAAVTSLTYIQSIQNVFAPPVTDYYTIGILMPHPSDANQYVQADGTAGGVYEHKLALGVGSYDTAGFNDIIEKTIELFDVPKVNGQVPIRLEADFASKRTRIAISKSDGNAAFILRIYPGIGALLGTPADSGTGGTEYAEFDYDNAPVSKVYISADESNLLGGTEYLKIHASFCINGDGVGQSADSSLIMTAELDKTAGAHRTITPQQPLYVPVLRNIGEIVKASVKIRADNDNRILDFGNSRLGVAFSLRGRLMHA